jgi:flagellar hook-associated protein 2
MVQRINGFSSGMDIDQLVSQLMQAQRVPLVKLEQKKQTLEWQRDDYRTLNSKLLDFRNTAFDMKLQSSYLTRSVASSHSSIITATAGAGASVALSFLRTKSAGISGTTAPFGGAAAFTTLA